MIFLTILKRNIRRTPYQALAATMVMFLTFFTIVLFIILASGSQEILRYYESKAQAIAFFKDGTTSEDVKAIEVALNQTGKVTALKFISKDEALKIYRERNKDKPTLLELVTANILPASLEISTVTPNDLELISQVLNSEPVIEEVVYPRDVVQSLTNATSIVRWVGGGIVVFSIVFAFLMVLMVIGFKIRIKRNEIEIMKLLGASTWFIKAPFILEGITYGLIGGVSAWILSYILIWYFTPFISGLVHELNLLPISPLLMLLLLVVVLILAFLIGVLGSYGAVRRYLKL